MMRWAPPATQSASLVPKSLLVRRKEKPIMQNDTRISVDVAKAVLEVAISDRPGHVVRRERLRATTGGSGMDGGLWLCALLGPEAPSARPPRDSPPASPRAALPAAQQDRPRGRQGSPRPSARAGPVHPGGRQRGRPRSVGAHRRRRLRTAGGRSVQSSPTPAARSERSRLA